VILGQALIVVAIISSYVPCHFSARTGLEDLMVLLYRKPDSAKSDALEMSLIDNGYGDVDIDNGDGSRGFSGSFSGLDEPKSKEFTGWAFYVETIVFGVICAGLAIAIPSLSVECWSR
jgi:hypothetical protein